jgi:hypothetical protein
MIYQLENDENDNPKIMRMIRDQLLKDSDWSQLPDATCDREAWAKYRQALRDFPATWTEAPEADFPDTP